MSRIKPDAPMAMPFYFLFILFLHENSSWILYIIQKYILCPLLPLCFFSCVDRYFVQNLDLLSFANLMHYLLLFVHVLLQVTDDLYDVWRVIKVCTISKINHIRIFLVYCSLHFASGLSWNSFTCWRFFWLTKFLHSLYLAFSLD
jgi:hypothetical protein